MILSPSQEIAKTKISKFLKGYHKMFILEGSAGTGKSTVITHILEEGEFVNKKIVYSATTNKAVSVLKKYSNNSEKYSFCTIHKLLNIKRKINSTGQGVFDIINDSSKAKSIYQYDIIVIDESSMITSELLTKMIKIVEKIRGKIIFLGDPAQLPPVNESHSLIFHTRDIPKFRLKEIMRYKGQIVDLCNSVREIVFDTNFKIKFSDFKSSNIKIFKDFDKSISKYLKFVKGGFRPIYLVYTNKKCDLINSTVRANIFKGTKKRFEEGEIILFNNYYMSPKGTKYYTSQQMIVKDLIESSIDLSGIDIKNIFKIKKNKNKDDCCVLCNNIVQRDSVCGCKLCNQCSSEWLNNKLVCPYCYINVTNNIVEIKGDEHLSLNINQLVDLFEDKKFKIYELILDNKDSIKTIHGESLKEYNIFIDKVKEKLKDIKTYIDVKYKKNKLFNNVMLNLWENFYQKYIDTIADISYGYAITTHKSQGSNYKVVFVDMKNIITNNTNQKESYRCLYTAVTRTSKYLNILM
tara:strand:- start:363 stop:1925 length:1563 start_codon:yes stop_codon:yes gene_type:complete